MADRHMIVKVLYFAGARDLASVPGEQVSLGEGASIGDLAGALLLKHPALKRMERSLRFAVNLEVADQGEGLSDGDEVGVLPPVAGG